MLAGVLGKSKTDSMLNEYAALVGDAVLRQRARLAEHKARIEIELAKRVKSEFLANMSHELRTPLNTVIGFSKLLSDHGKQKLTDAQVVQYAELIRDAGDHLLSVINDILDITKIQSGAYALESNEVDLIDVLHSCTESVRAAADIAGITLRENIAFNLPPVRGDDAKLAQVFKNLLNNAIKFTLKDGEVVLKAFRQGDGGVIVSVRDNGIGMTDEEARVAVLPFGQVDGGRARLREGAGLGLPIAKSLVELHGGKLLITSVKGRGTEITVRLPPRDQVSVAEGRDAVYGRGPSA
jgi:two-component system, cell cycle sensor histidine kinase PleC